MKPGKHPDKPVARRSIMAVAMFAIATTSACTGNMTANEAAKKRGGVVARADTSGPARLNLLSGGSTTSAGRTRASKIGDGSYLCTPAGFGQRSWCRRN